MAQLTRRTVVRSALAGGFALAAPGILRAQTQTAVRMLHIETNKAVLDIWQKAASTFEATNPGVKIEMRSLETEAFKARLPTILQSNSRPHLFYSWGGGLVDQQAKAGFLEDISAQVEPAYRETLMPAAMAQFARGPAVYGLPYNTAQIGLLYNRELFAKADVKAQDMLTWPGFVAGVKALKAAGILPVAAGGQDKWQLMLMLSNLGLRQGGKAAIEAALAGQSGGFDNPAFVQAAEFYREFSALSPYQEGFMAMKAQPASGLFADGKAAMLMHGSWFVRQNPAVASDRKGLSVEQLGFLGFPMLPGGAGTAKETLVNLNGWLVSKGAPKAAVDFLKYFHSAPVAGELAEGGYIVPANLAVRDKLSHPLMREAADNIAKMDFIQTGYNVLLGANAGKVSEDVSVGLATGSLTGKDACAQLERARQQDVREN
jgi:raffinose/stachyose/melibiose transport system substrate-binding protein